MSKVMEHQSFFKKIIIATAGISIYYLALISFSLVFPLVIWLNKGLRILHLSTSVLFDILFDSPFTIMFCIGGLVISIAIKEKRVKPYFLVYIFFFYIAKAYFFLQAMDIQPYMISIDYLIGPFFNVAITVGLGLSFWKLANIFGARFDNRNLESSVKIKGENLTLLLFLIVIILIAIVTVQLIPK